MGLSKDFRYLLLGFILILVFLFPYFYMGENSYITPHDFLDSTWGHLNNIVNNNAFFLVDAELPLMYGCDRSGIVYTSMFDVKSIIFYLFPPYWAVVVNLLLVKTIAFVGMYLLLSFYLIIKNKGLSFILSLAFSLVPFYVDYGISSAGIPILTFSLLNLYKNKHIQLSYFFVSLYAFYSSIGLSGIFVCFLLFIAIILFYYQGRQWNKHLIVSLIILCVVYLIANWNVLYGFFFKEGFVSHRSEWYNDMSLKDILLMCLNYFIQSQYHAGTFWALPMYILSITTYILVGRSDKEYTYCMIVFVIVFSLTIIGELSRLLPSTFFTSFQFGRFFFILPTICFVIYALSCAKLYTPRILCILAIILSFVCVFKYNTEYKINIKKLITSTNNTSFPSYKQFFDTNLFGYIAKRLELPQNYTVRTAALGFYPSVMEYNGFWCMDGYLNSYSLDYKKKFRKAIATELQKDENIKAYFDNVGGSRCYLYSSELGKEFLVHKGEKEVNNLEINVNALKELGCQYLFSAVNIKNFKDLKIEFKGVYSSDESFYKIYVYKL